MIKKENLLKVGLEEEKANQVIELLGTAADKLYSEDGYAKAMADIDRSVLTSFGIAKNNDEKTTDYIKRAASEKATTELQEKEEKLNGEIADLKTKLAAKPGDEKLIKELEDLKAEKAKIPDLIDEKVKEWKDKFENANGELETFKQRTLIEKHLPKFKEGTDSGYANYLVDGVISKITDSKEIKTLEDGKVVVYDPVNHDRQEIGDYLLKELDSIAFKKVNQNGGGANGDGGAGDGGAGDTKLTFADGASAGEKYNAIKDYLGTQEGLSKMDANYSKRLNELCIEHELEDYIVEKPKAE